MRPSRHRARKTIICSAVSLILNGCATLAPDAGRLVTSTTIGASPWDWSYLGRAKHREIFALNLRNEAPLSDSSSLGALEFSAVVLTHTPFDTLPQSQCLATRHILPGPTTLGEYEDRCYRRLVSSIGIGVAPLSFSRIVARSPRRRLTLDASGGGVLFDRPTPYESTSQFNFSASVGATLLLGMSWPRFATLSLGYHFLHYSNAGLGELNPGIGLHTFSIGWVPR